MAEFKLQDGQNIEGDATAFTLESFDHYTPTSDEMKYRRRLNGFQQQLMQLGQSSEELRNDEAWIALRRECIELLKQTAVSFIRDLISAEDAYLMTYVHQGFFEGMVASAAVNSTT